MAYSLSSGWTDGSVGLSHLADIKRYFFDSFPVPFLPLWACCLRSFGTLLVDILNFTASFKFL